MNTKALKKLTKFERTKIKETIRSLKTWSILATRLETEVYREQIHVLQKKIDQDDNLKAQGLKKPSVRGLKTVCRRVIATVGLKVDGTLKKGYKYEGPKVVKVKPPVRKKPATKKRVSK